jgi:hypothetical protein
MANVVVYPTGKKRHVFLGFWGRIHFHSII